MFFFIPDLFTPYIEGREKAIDRNWNDQKNFYDVQKNQLSNLYDLATLSPRVNQEYEKTAAEAFKNRTSARKDYLDEQLFPGLATVAGAQGQILRNNAPTLAAANVEAKYLNPNGSGGGSMDFGQTMAQWPLFLEWLRGMTQKDVNVAAANAAAAGTGTGDVNTNGGGTDQIPTLTDPRAKATDGKTPSATQ